MKCKNCEVNDSIKYSKYSSGEFCSKKCSTSFSTKNKREEINKKVSLKLTKDKISKICEYCEIEYFINYNRRTQSCCSRKCSAKKKMVG